MKTLIQSLIILFLFAELKYSQWYQQNSGTTRGLLGVTFVDVNNGWAVGDSGTILHTTNGGLDWIAQESGTTRMLYDVSFTDLLHGTAVGDSGEILRTNDGGINWFQQPSGTNAFLRRVSFINSDIGWVVGCLDNSPNYYGVILHTENAGEIWEQQFVLQNQFLFGVSFVDADNGWVVGLSGLILKTTNGGESWLQQNSGSMFPLIDVSFVDENSGWAVGGWHDIAGTALKTIDGGVTWTELFISPVANISVCFTDENIGMVINCDFYYDDRILRTTNGGANWEFQLSGEAMLLSDVFCIDALNAWAVGGEGTILHTTNGGVPVELTSFTATTNSKEVILNWSTATELNNRGFEILRCTWNDQEWRVIGYVPGYGTTTELKSYSYPDPEVSKGRYTYRLKQIDFDGSFEYSKEIEVEVTALFEFALEQNYPNPFNPSTMIRYQLQVSSDVTLKVFDILGNEIATLVDEFKPEGRYDIEFNATKLPSGVYFYHLRAGKYVETKRMLLLK